jgi:predicted nucleic-acid-binding Zn-ribbon protein
MSNNTVKCPSCDFASAIVKESGKGGLSVHCSDCGYQGFARTPKSASALRAKLGGTAAPKNDKQPAAGGGFDLAKL